MTTNHTTAQSFETIADVVNASYKSHVVILDGIYEVRPYGMKPANVFQNGTLAIDVKAKTTGRTRVLYWKTGTAAPAVEVR